MQLREKFQGAQGPVERIRSLTGVGTKIWGPQHKSFCQCQIFRDLSIQKKTPWAASQAFMSGRLIALNNLSRVCPVGVGEMGAVFLKNVYLK